MLFRKFTELQTAMLQNSAISLIFKDKLIKLPATANNTIEDLYSSLHDYENVQITALDGVILSKSTRLHELSGSAFFLNISEYRYKIMQTNPEIEKYSHLFSSLETHVENYASLHKFLRTLEVNLKPRELYSKNSLISIINESIPIEKFKEKKNKDEIVKTIDEIYKDIEKMKPVHNQLASKSKSVALSYLWGGFAITIAQALYIGSNTFYFSSWDVMEAQAYLIGLANSIVSVWVLLRFRIEFSQLGVYNWLFTKKMNQYAARANFDLEEYEAKLKKLEELQRSSISGG
jgi:hypothetical protein